MAQAKSLTQRAAQTRVAVALAALTLALGLSAPAAAASLCDDMQAGYVQPELPDSDTVLIFVHGLSGDPRATWRHGADAKSAWPCLLKNDSQFAKANFFLYGYPTGFLGQQPSIGDVAVRMLEELAPVMWRHRQVVFVVHSLGGLVTSQMLMKVGTNVSQRELLRRTKLVMFYGSPGGGSAAAQLASLVKPAVQVQELADLRVLDAIVSRWRESDIGKKGRCYAETRPMGGVIARTVDWFLTLMPGQQPSLIVRPESAYALCAGDGRPISQSDHGEIVKPPMSQHDAYKALATQFHACVRPPKIGTVGATLAGTRTAEAVRLWRERFEPALQALRAQAGDSGQLTVWLHEPQQHSFLQTPDADPAAPPPFRRGVVSRDQFMLALRDATELAPAGALEQTAVAWVKDVGVIVEDVEVRARVDQLLQAGRLRNDDVAVVLEDAEQANRWLMWLAAPAHEADNALLRGVTRLPRSLRCAHLAE